MDRRKFIGMGAAVLAMAVTPMTSLRAVDFRATKPKAWQSEKSADAIKEMFGSSGLKTTDKIKFTAPKLAENGGSIPLNITTKLDLETIAVFQDANPRSLTAVFTVPEGAIIKYDFRIKMRQTAFVTIVGKERKTGKLYTTKREIDVSIGGCGG